MTTDYNRLRELFIAACDLSRDEQQHFIDAQCNNNYELRSDLQRLLKEDSSPHTMLADDAVAVDFVDADVFDDETLPESIGRYTPRRRIGAGGMGVVYLAEQNNPKRDVAVKVIRRGQVGHERLRRFKAEAAVLARLQHSNIAQVYEAGTFDDGGGARPFFAMEYVDGVPLNQFVQSKQITVRDRLTMFVRICEAVHHAHQRGIIHRDLKPANILVTETGQPKILDFGVARATDSDLQVSTLQTDVGQLIGTLPYMSPEQVTGRGIDVDTRSDVYALGVILYELLAGRLPYDVDGQSIVAAARVITESDPLSLTTIDRMYRGDLNTIVCKALEKDPEHRYQSASDLAADVQHYLHDEPIIARPATTMYQIRKFAQRNRGLTAGLVAVFITLALGITGTTWGLIRAVEQADRAANESNRAYEAELEAKQRAEELAQVVRFQALQISRIEPTLFGARIRDGIMSQQRRALEGVGDEAEADAALQNFEQSLSNVDFTALALQVVEESMFAWSLREIEKRFEDQPLVKARLLQSIATSMRWASLIEQAEQPQVEALEIRRRLLGEAHPLTLNSFSSMGRLLKVQDRLDEAEPYLRRAMIGRKEVLGPDHPEALKSVNLYGILLRSQDRPEEAEPYYRAALEGFQRTLADDHRLVLFSMANLGSLLRDMGRIEEAEPLTRRALEGKRAKYGNDHMETILSTLDLGLLLQMQQKFAEAEKVFLDALDRSIRVLGETHFITLDTHQFLGELFHEQRRFDEAEHHYRLALRGRRNVLGDEHTGTQYAAQRLVSLLLESGRDDEAAVLYQQFGRPAE